MRVVKVSQLILNDTNKIRKIDRSDMLSFCLNAAHHFRKAKKAAERIVPNFSKPKNIIVAGMGGSAIGGELLKDLTRDNVKTPIEINRDYSLPAYANEKSLVLIISYSGETEETLSAFLSAVRNNCMIFCLSSGGDLLNFAEKLGVPYLKVPSGVPPRAALPYLFIPLLVLAKKIRIVSSASVDLSEALNVLEILSDENSPEKTVNENFAKTLALGLDGTVPVAYGYGIFRGVAQRFKTQFNENSKIPSKWEYFSELNHNEIEGWEQSGKLAKYFSAIFIRDKYEANEIRKRIEITKTLMNSDSKQFEVWSKGKSILARMLSTVYIGDYTSIYLAILRNIDPTPVYTIGSLKTKIKLTGTKKKIIGELRSLIASR